MTTLNILNETHEITYIIKGNKNYIKCDHCGKVVEESEAMKASKGKTRNYAYCPECTKRLYPTYRKIHGHAFNTNPIMNNIMRENNARYEKLR